MKKRTLPVLAAIAALSATAFVACGSDHTHTYKWEKSATSHWQVCDCGDKTDEKPHVDEKINATGEAGKDELCDDCGYDLHAHDYAWQSDGAGHWKTCSCGDTTDPQPHADAKNNDDPEDATPDGKCDDCGRSIFDVTFNVRGHGTAPDVQHVAEDGHAVKPDDPADDDSWKFKGWFKDVQYKVEFDFAAEKITAPTTVYAKWEDDITPGASKNHAHELALDEENQKPAVLGKAVYYKFTSPEDGRYTVSLALGASGDGTFTVEGQEGTFGKDCDAQSVTLDIDNGTSVYILYTYKGESTEDITVSPVVEVAADEPLPTGYFLDGEYYNNVYTLVIDRENNRVILNEVTFALHYVGGKYDRIYFIQSNALVDMTFYLSHKADGTYVLSKKEGTRPVSEIGQLQYLVAEEPIPVSKFAGLYEPETTAGDGISQIGIFENGGGYLVQHDIRQEQEFGSYATYDQNRNTLTFSQYSFTLILDGDTVTGIKVVGGNISKALVYVRKGDAVAELALPLTGNEYNGDVYTIAKDITGTGGYRWGNGSYGLKIEVKDYDKDTGFYSVINSGWDDEGNPKDYTLKLIIGDEDIKVYDEDGETLLDTLVEFVPVFHDMPTSGVATTLAAADFNKDFYWFTVAKDGWYNLSASGDSTVVYYGLSKSAPTDSFGMDVKTAGSGAVDLKQGSLIGVYIGNYYTDKPQSITFTATETEEPAGLREDNPLELENGKGEIADINNQDKYYIRYTNIAPGTYAVGCVYVSYGNDAPVHFVIDDEEYGYIDWSNMAHMTRDFPYAIITIDEVTTLDIVADAIGVIYGTENLTVYVVPYYGESGTAISGDSGDLAAGTYRLDASVQGVKKITLSSDSDFTVECKGEQTTQKSLDLTPAQLKFGFKLTGSASYEIAYNEGTAKNPVIITEMGSHQVQAGHFVKVTAPADQDVLLSLSDDSDRKYCFTYNGVKYGYESNDGFSFTPIEGKLKLSLTAGTTALIKVFCDGGEYEGEIELVLACNYTIDATDVVFVKGDPVNDKVTATATISQTGNYHIESSLGSNITVTSSAAFTIKLSNGQDLTAAANEGVYSVTITAAKDLYFNVSAMSQDLTLKAEYAKGSEGYPLAIALENDSYTLKVKIGEYVYFTLAEGTYSFADANSYWDPTMYLNGKMIDNVGSVQVTANDVLGVYGGYYGLDLVIGIGEDEPDVPVGDSVTYLGKINENDSKIVITGDRVSYYMDMGSGFKDGVIVENALLVKGDKEGEFKFTYSSGTVIIKIAGDSMDVDDEGWKGTLTKQADTGDDDAGTADNPAVVELNNGSATVTLPTEEDYYIQLPAGTYVISDGGQMFVSVSTKHGDEEPEFANMDMTTGTYTVTIEEGDLVVLGGSNGMEITITAA